MHDFFNSALRSLPVLFPGKSNNKIIDNNPPARLVIFLGMQRETNNLFAVALGDGGDGLMRVNTVGIG